MSYPTTPVVKVESETEAKTHSAWVERIFWPLLLGTALLIAMAVTWFFTATTSTVDSSENNMQPQRQPNVTTGMPEKTAVTDDSTTTTESMVTSAEDTKPPIPPPAVNWSTLSEQLLELEQERTAIINLFLSQMPTPPKTIAKVVTKQSPPPLKEKETLPVAPKKTLNHISTKVSKPSMAIPEDLTWTTVGKQLLELEQQREKTLTLLTNPLK